CMSRLSLIVRCAFVFSSRRRHTRSKRDWSSDVCSSDLGRVQHPEIAESYAQEGSIAQESGKPTRGKGPSPRNREIPRAGELHRSGIVESHAREGSIAQESQNFTRGKGPSLRNYRISRAGRRSIEHEHRLKL